MMRETRKLRRLVFSVLIAVVISLLPLAPAHPVLMFLWLPGTLVGELVVGYRIIFTSFIPLRVVASAIMWSLLLYFGAALWSWGETRSTRQTPAANYVFVFWVLLLLPWLALAGLSGMAFDAGYSAEAYTFFWSVWMYPITVGIAAVIRRWTPWIALLPLLNLAACTASEFLHK